MSKRSVEEFLRTRVPVALYTKVIIFQLEDDPRYVRLVDPIFRWLERPGSRAITSTVTMLELLVLPYRLSDKKRLDDCYAFLATYPHLEWVAPGLEIAVTAARLRAEHNLSTPDAIQAATALENGARGFVSNDSAFRRVRGIDVLILDDLR